MESSKSSASLGHRKTEKKNEKEITYQTDNMTTKEKEQKKNKYPSYVAPSSVSSPDRFRNVKANEHRSAWNPYVPENLQMNRFHQFSLKTKKSTEHSTFFGFCWICRFRRLFLEWFKIKLENRRTRKAAIQRKLKSLRNRINTVWHVSQSKTKSMEHSTFFLAFARFVRQHRLFLEWFKIKRENQAKRHCNPAKAQKSAKHIRAYLFQRLSFHKTTENKSLWNREKKRKRKRKGTFDFFAFLLDLNVSTACFPRLNDLKSNEKTSRLRDSKETKRKKKKKKKKKEMEPSLLFAGFERQHCLFPRLNDLKSNEKTGAIGLVHPAKAQKSATKQSDKTTHWTTSEEQLVKRSLLSKSKEEKEKKEKKRKRKEKKEKKSKERKGTFDFFAFAGVDR